MPENDQTATAPPGCALTTGSEALQKLIEDIRSDGQEMERLVWEHHARVSMAGQIQIKKLHDVQEAMNDIADIMDMPTGCSPADCVDAVRGMRRAITETLAENRHLADGDFCPLIKLKRASTNRRLARPRN